ncbi:MAG: RnfABCDGE type electron transport complex subunit D [Gammaproteobacteria bacterium]
MNRTPTTPWAQTEGPRQRPITGIRDARPYQIAVQGVLLLYGIFALGLEFDPGISAAYILSALAAQYAFSLGGRFDPLSALISALSLCLLLRTDSLVLAAAAGAGAIAAKFCVRWRGAHVFNPSCIAIVAALLLSDSAWISPGQWGRAAWLTLAIGCLGLVVLTRARRLDISLAFLVAWAALMFARAGWLGDPLGIPWHQMQNASLLIFAFYMLSDPKTTPLTATGRALYACIVAAAGAVAVFAYYEPAGLIYALAACAPLRFVIDRIWPPEKPAGTSPRILIRDPSAPPCTDPSFPSSTKRHRT